MSGCLKWMALMCHFHAYCIHTQITVFHILGIKGTSLHGNYKKNFTNGLCGIVMWHMGQRCLIVLIIDNKLVLAFLKFILPNVMLKHSTILIQIYYFNLMRVRRSYVSDSATPCKLHQLKFLKPLGIQRCLSIISCLLTGREKPLARD